MSVFHPREVRCACGTAILAQLADSVNGGRSPRLRAMILDGTLHRVECPECGEHATVETSFHYVDFARGVVFQVRPRGDRHRSREASSALREAVTAIPRKLLDPAGRTLRVVFGMDELREKLVAQDLAIPDVDVELLKVLLLYEHPVLRKRPRLRLTLDGESRGAYRFLASSDHDQRSFHAYVPVELARQLRTPGHPLHAWATAPHRPKVEREGDDWVNVWQCSPQPGALGQLRAYAAALAVDGDAAVPTDSAEFAAMVAGLPCGDHLPRWAKRDLRAMVDVVERRGPPSLLDPMFEKRFGFLLDDDWGTNATPAMVETIWDALDRLPDGEVEGNTQIKHVELDTETGGSRYKASTRDIIIGTDDLDGEEHLKKTLRHEVGHAVHEANRALVDGWLEQLGWQSFPNTAEGLEAWVERMEGWEGIAAPYRDEVRRFLLTSIGTSEHWGPTPADSPKPADNPWRVASPPPRLRRAFDGSGAATRWYEQADQWYASATDAFFMNYYYATFVAVRLDTYAIIRRMPDPYAGMSASEFFAEVYAEFRDPERKHWDRLGPDILDWLQKHLAPEDPPVGDDPCADPAADAGGADASGSGAPE